MPTATMEAATTVESTSAMIPTGAMEASAMKPVASMHSTDVAASIAMGIDTTSVAESRTSIEATAIISPIPEPSRMTPVIPRSRANKHAAYEPIRPVIAVRRTGIRIIVIVSIRANRRTGRVAGTDSDPNANLRLRVR